MVLLLGRVSRRTSWVVGCLSIAAWHTFAGWNGAGVTGGTDGTNINDTANWAGGVIDDDFSTITANADLRLTADYTTVNGLNFVESNKNIARHITISGTNTITLNGFVSGHTLSPSQIHLFLPSNTTSTVTLNKGLILNMPATRRFSGNGILLANAQITGPGGFNNAYSAGHSPQNVLLNDANSFTGNVDGDYNWLYFTSIADKGVPSALGAGTFISLNNYHVVYIGSRDQGSNRGWSFMNGNVGVLNHSACGGLSLTGTVATTYKITGLNLGGVSAGESLMTAAIKNSDAASFVRLTKLHSGFWRLTGNNTFTGYTNESYAVYLRGGTLVADYTNDVAGAGSNRVFLAGRNVYFYDGKLLIQGKTGTGNTTYQELGTNTIENNSFNVLTADGNGGDGTTVTMNDLVMASSLGILRLERLNNAAIYATRAFSSVAGSVRTVNGMLLGANGTRANLLVKDPDGRTGFAAQNEALEFVRHTNTLALTADNATSADHTSLATDLTRTADLNFSTLAVDASAQAVTLDLGGKSFQTDNSANGRGIVVNGSYPVTVRGGTHGAQGSTFINHYGTGKLSWELTNGTCAYVTAGPGLTEITQPVLSNLVLAEGVTRLTSARNFSEGYLYVYGNGVLEIGADLNGAATGDFTRSIGTSAGQIYFYAGGGFSAYGADRTVNLGGAGSAVGWIVPEGKPLVLSSPHANATLILINPLSLSTYRREFRVQNGSAAVDARLTGRIYGTGAGALIKSGNGTLELTGNQDYRGDCSVIGGGLRLGANDVFAGGTNALVLSGATLDAGTARNTFNTLELLADSVIEVGNGSATLAFADCGAKPWTGTLTINGKLAATTLRFGTDGNSLTAAQLAASSNGGYSVYLDDQGYLRQIPPGTLIFVQ